MKATAHVNPKPGAVLKYQGGTNLHYVNPDGSRRNVAQVGEGQFVKLPKLNKKQRKAAKTK